MGYWENRQAQMMYEYMEDAEKVSKEIADVYAKASRELNYRMQNIFEKYRDRYGLTDEEAKALLNTMHSSTDLNELREAVQNMAANDPAKVDLLKEIESPAYRARIERLQNLQEEIDHMMQNVYQQEKKISTDHYIDLASDSYYREIYNVQRQVGFQFSFSAVDPQQLNRVLASTWSGANYSTRIWGNTEALAEDLKEQLIIGLLTGKKESEIAKELNSTYAGGAFNARRLVRTESNFVNGQMQRAAYEECDADKYDFVAVLDLRTSEICRSLDGQVFLTKDMEPGKNCNPMHPFCRSTTTIHIDDDLLSGLQRRARDPVTGDNKLVPAGTNYQKWYEQNVANNPKAQAAEKMMKNRSSDKKQYERYRETLGKKAGKTFEHFQNMKYNEAERWKEINTSYKDIKLKDKIKTDSYNKTIKSGQQRKHILGTNEYTEGRSYLTVTEEQAQELVNKYAGSGRIIRSSNTGKWQNKEKIVADHDIGQYINSFDGTNESTNAFMITYAKDGVHIIPARRE